MPEAKFVMRASDETAAAFNSFNKSVGKAEGSVVSLTKTVASAVGVAGMGAFVQMQGEAALQTIAYARALDASVREMSVFAKAGKEVFLTADQINGILKDTGERIGEAFSEGTGEAAEALEALNINVAEIVQLSPDQQLMKIAEAMQGVALAGERSAIWEKLGNDLTLMDPLLRNNAKRFKEVRAEMIETGQVLTELEAQKLEAANQSFLRAQRSVEAFGEQMAVEAAPIVQALSDNLDVLTTSAGVMASVMAGRVVSGVAGSTQEMIKNTVAVRAQTVAAKTAAEAAIVQHKGLVAQYQATQAAIGANHVHVASLRKQVAASAKATVAARTHAVAMEKSAGSARIMQTVMGGLGGPVGVITMAASAAALWAMTSNDAANETGEFADETERLGKGMGAVGAQGVSQKIADITAQIEQARGRMVNYQKGIEAVQAKLDNPAQVAGLQNLIEVEAEKITGLDAQLSRLQQTNERLKSLLAGDDPDAGAGKNKGLESTLQSLNAQRQALGLNQQQLTLYNASLAISKAENQSLAKEVWASAQALSEAQAAMAQKQVDDQRSSDISQQFQVYVQSLNSEEQALEQSYLKRSQLISDALANGDIQQDEARGRQLYEANLYQNQLSEIEQAGWTDRQKFAAQSMGQQAKTVFGHMASVTAGVAQHDKKMFRINQVAGVANALISTYEGIAKAWSYGPILGPAMSGLVAAAGFAQVKAIKSAKFGGGGGVAPSVSGSTGATQSVNAVQPVVPISGRDRASMGGSVSYLQLVGKDSDTLTIGQLEGVSDFLEKAWERGDRVLFTRGSRQGMELTG